MEVVSIASAALVKRETILAEQQPIVYGPDEFGTRTGFSRGHVSSPERLP
jgi:hypothetical protein